MASAQPSGRGFRRTILVALFAIALTVMLTIVVSGWPSNDAPPRATENVSPTGPSPSPAPTATVRCTEEPEPLTQGLTGVACPSAILAVELAIAPVRLPIERIFVEPGPFYCDLLWPGVQTAPPCVGYATRPGQFMHAWVTFAGSSKVAVVMLGLNLPADDAPSASRPPWHSTLVAVEIPPDGWVMP